MTIDNMERDMEDHNFFQLCEELLDAKRAYNSKYWDSSEQFELQMPPRLVL
jgi:hypothetical protein